MSSSELKRRKIEARKTFLKARMGLDEDETAQKNSQIFEQVVRLEAYRSAKTVHLYASMKNRNEADTFELMKYSLDHGKQIIVPVMKENGRLIHSTIRSPDELRENSWGVPEPVDPTPAEGLTPDLIIVPMVAGDLEKNRLGYGKGYYDRFLKGKEMLKAGLLFEVQLSKEPLPTGAYDVPLDLLVTEKRVIR